MAAAFTGPPQLAHNVPSAARLIRKFGFCFQLVGPSALASKELHQGSSSGGREFLSNFYARAVLNWRSLTILFNFQQVTRLSAERTDGDGTPRYVSILKETDAAL